MENLLSVSRYINFILGYVVLEGGREISFLFSDAVTKKQLRFTGNKDSNIVIGQYCLLNFYIQAWLMNPHVQHVH